MNMFRTSLGSPRDASAEFIEVYNHRYCQEYIGNVTLMDVSYGRRGDILRRREEQELTTIDEQSLDDFGKQSDLPTGELEARNPGLPNGLR